MDKKAFVVRLNIITIVMSGCEKPLLVISCYRSLNIKMYVI